MSITSAIAQNRSALIAGVALSAVNVASGWRLCVRTDNPQGPSYGARSETKRSTTNGTPAQWPIPSILDRLMCSAEVRRRRSTARGDGSLGGVHDV